MSPYENHWEVGTDIGGTFTDIIAIRRSPAEARIAKVPSRPQAPVQAMLEAIEAVGLRKSEVKRFVHGTTRVTNAIVEGRLPKVALVDPELTHDLPAELTASTGLDALTQLIEPYVSCKANPLTDSICAEGIRRAAHSLRRVFDVGADKSAREDMALASLFGGLALANAGLGAVHGFASPIGGMFRAPHGAVCAALLPHVMEANLIALRQRAPHSEALRRYDDVARLLVGSDRARAAEGVVWVEHLCSHLKILPLHRYGITANDAAAIVAAAAKASSMKANPIELTAEELRRILERAL